MIVARVHTVDFDAPDAREVEARIERESAARDHDLLWAFLTPGSSVAHAIEVAVLAEDRQRWIAKARRTLVTRIRALSESRATTGKAAREREYQEHLRRARLTPEQRVDLAERLHQRGVLSADDLARVKEAANA